METDSNVIKSSDELSEVANKPRSSQDLLLFEIYSNPESRTKKCLNDRKREEKIYFDPLIREEASSFG